MESEARLRDLLLEREERGLSKYGVATDRKDLGLSQWLQHLLEELLDAAVYVERARRELNSSISLVAAGSLDLDFRVALSEARVVSAVAGDTTLLAIAHSPSAIAVTAEAFGPMEWRNISIPGRGTLFVAIVGPRRG